MSTPPPTTIKGADNIYYFLNKELETLGEEKVNNLAPYIADAWTCLGKAGKDVEISEDAAKAAIAKLAEATGHRSSKRISFASDLVQNCTINGKAVDGKTLEAISEHIFSGGIGNFGNSPTHLTAESDATLAILGANKEQILQKWLDKGEIAVAKLPEQYKHLTPKVAPAATISPAVEELMNVDMKVRFDNLKDMLPPEAHEFFEPLRPTFEMMLPIEQIKKLNITTHEKNEILQKLVENLDKGDGIGAGLDAYVSIQKAGGTIDAALRKKMEIFVAGVAGPNAAKEHIEDHLTRYKSQVEALDMDVEYMRKVANNKEFAQAEMKAHMPELNTAFEEIKAKINARIDPKLNEEVKATEAKVGEVNKAEEIGAETPKATTESTASEAAKTVENAAKGERKWFEFFTHDAEGAFSGKRAGVSGVVALLAAIGIGTALNARKQHEAKKETQLAGTERA
jgi:hypothetical protein